MTLTVSVIWNGTSVSDGCKESNPVRNRNQGNDLAHTAPYATFHDDVEGRRSQAERIPDREVYLRELPCGFPQFRVQKQLRMESRKHRLLAGFFKDPDSGDDECRGPDFIDIDIFHC